MHSRSERKNFRGKIMRRFFKKQPNTFLDPDEIFADSIGFGGFYGGSEGKIERPIGKFPYGLFLFLIGGVFSYLLVRAGMLQIQSGDAFFAKSQENRFVTRSVSAPRGILYDMYGEALVENYPSFEIALERDEFFKSGNSTEEILSVLAKVLKKPEEYFFDRGFPKSEIERKKMPMRLVLAENISPEEIVPIAPKLNGIPGITTTESFRRVYKDGPAFSHALGYLGRVSEQDLLRFQNLAQDEYIGKAGVEFAYDQKLRGSKGKKIIEMDAAGKETRFKLLDPARPGSDLELTIDGALQEKIYEILLGYTGGTKSASVVAVDPRDGAIRALVSFPGFDANLFGYSLSAKEFSSIVNDPRKPLFNRAIGGEFPSGSVIKPLFAAAALQENIISPAKKIHDTGYIEIPNPYKPGEASRFVDWKIGGHGWVDMYDAIAYSVNVYFYTIGGGFGDQKGLGIEKLKKYAQAFGLGSVLGIDIPGEKAGLFPDPEWKKNADKTNPIWRIGDTYNTSIGQGGVKVTPLQIAMATAALANGGVLYQPHVYKSILEKDGFGNIHKQEQFDPKIIRENIISRSALREVAKGMRQTVTEGVARLLSGLSVPVAAKTGTAQAGSGLPHAWVATITPSENPELVMVVMVEHAGEGSTVAVPITNEVLRWYMGRKTPNEELQATTTPPVNLSP